MKIRNLLVAAALLVPSLVFAQSAAINTALSYLDAQAPSFGHFPSDVDDLLVTDAYQSRRSGATHVYVRQRFNGIEIADANYAVNVDRAGDVFHVAGKFEVDIASRIANSTPGISAQDAVAALADEVGLIPTGAFTVLSSEGGPSQAATLSEGGISLDPIPARLVYHTNEEGDIALTWLVSIYQLDAMHYWVGRVDAQTGEVVHLSDHVVNDSYAAPNSSLLATSPTTVQRIEAEAQPFAYAASVNDYRVFEFPYESPDHHPTPPPADGRTLQNNPADASASQFGWHDTNGSAGNEFTDTRGNNVHAYTDTNGDNNPDPGSDPDCGASILCDFDFPINFAVDAPSTYRDAAVTNLFYWSNVIHDIMWQYGFDEAGGNFQVNNYGNGGLGNDDVRAEAQNLGNCNANFFTPADGSRPRMQMFTCNASSPAHDSDFDNGVIIHEYGHGVSNRLVGGPSNVSCLQHSEQMGEGWSDFLALLMTMESGVEPAGGRGIGTYLLGQPTTGPGIRITKYSTNFAINDRTHNDIGNSSRSGGHPHGTGYVWSTILYEVLWELIDDFGWDADLYDANGTAGNQVMMQLVTEGMKNAGCNPGFVDARDGIYAAEASIYGNMHLTQLCDGFARRGLGTDATQGSVNSRTDNTDGFTPCVIPVELDHFGSVVDNGDVVLSWSTASETNNSGFEIQHWTSDQPLETLGFVEGHGTTTEAQAYNFRATDLAAGTHTFRLKQIDFDGAFEYSPEVEVVVGVPGSHVLSNVYPNPFNPQAQFNLALSEEQDVSIAIFDVMGRQVATIHEGELSANQSHEFTVDGAGLASGAYMIRVVGENFAETRRITLLK